MDAVTCLVSRSVVHEAPDSGATSTHVAISASELVRTGLCSWTVDGKVQAKLDGVARQNPLRAAKLLKNKRSESGGEGGTLSGPVDSVSYRFQIAVPP